MCVKCKYTKCRLVGFVFGSYLGWFKNLIYLGLLNGCGLLFFFVEFIIWAWLNTDWADSFVRHGLSGLKFLDWAVVILKILGPSKTGHPAQYHPLMNRVCQQLNYNQVGVCWHYCFVGFCFFGKFGLKTVKLLCLCSKCETIFWYSLYDRMHGYGNKYDIVTWYFLKK